MSAPEPNPPRESKVVWLRRVAEQLATQRRERLTTAHLLAAIAAQDCPAADELAERGLTYETLLRAARSATDASEKAVHEALERAKALAARTTAAEASEIHVLAALLGDASSGAHRVLVQCGCAVSRFRAHITGLATESIPAPRRRREAERDVGGEAGRGPARAVPISPQHPAAAGPARASASPAGAMPGPGATRSLPSSGPAPRTPPPPAPVALRPNPTPATPGAHPSGFFRKGPRPSEQDASAPAEPATGASPKGRGAAKARATAHGLVLSKKRFPALTELGVNLTLLAARGELEPVVARDAEIDQVLDVLAKRHGNNPCLVGTPGVGKTAIARGLAQRLAAMPPGKERVLIEIPVGELVAGTAVRGALAERLGKLRREVADSEGRVILFFDDLPQLFGDALDELGAELKLALSRGELPCVGTATPEAYRRAVELDPALARRFSVVEVDAPSREDAFVMLAAATPSLGEHHGVEYTDEALALSVAWTLRYLPGRALPDRALELLDLAGARQKRRGFTEVGRGPLAEVVAELGEVPLGRLLETDGERMLRLESLLAERVVGHEAELHSIAKILRRNSAGLGGRRPIGTVLLLGPTGVGKTETAKALAETLFFSDQAMTRIDLSEFSEAHSIARLIGAPPGYVGHEAGGQLTEAVRRRPYQVVLLDEIEKAHPEVLQAFLAAFDEGRLTDGRGRTVDLTQCVFLLTSNLGSREVASPKRVGFGAGERRGPGAAATDRERAELDARIIAAARQALSPELYNRLDEVLVFHPLERRDVARIAERLLATLGASLAERGVTLEVAPGVVDALLEAGGFDAELGARPLKRVLARQVEAPLAELLLRGAVERGGQVRLSVAPDGAGLVVESAGAG